MSEVTETFWERAAKSHWGKYVTAIEAEIIDRGQKMAGEPTEAIEIGCEGGRWSKMLADVGWRMTCLDVNADALGICKHRIPSSNCILTRPEDAAIYQPSGKFSLLLCIEVAPVIDSSWFLPEAARVLKTGGIMVTIVWNRFSLRGLVSRAQSAVRRAKKGEFYTRNYKPWRRSLTQNGFYPIVEEGFCWGPFGRMSNSPFIPLFVAAERSLFLHHLPSLSPWIAVIAQKK